MLRPKLSIFALGLFVYSQLSIAEPDPRVERVRQDLGYYKQSETNQTKVLEAQIQALREEMQQALAQQEQRIRQLEQALKQKSQSLAPVPATSALITKAIPQISSSDIISVCHQGCDTSDLQEAVKRVSAGGEINLAPELHGGCAVIDKSVRIVGRPDRDGNRPRLVGGVCMGKAPLVTSAANISIENLEISDINVGDGNGACVRMDPGTRDLTLRKVRCSNSQDGLLGSVSGLLLIEDSQFIGNGFGDGQAHGIYLSGGDQVVIRRSQILSTQNAGHSLKVGAAQLTVEDSVIAALDGHNSRAIDAFGGGNITLKNNIIQQGPQSDNNDMIGLALEPARLLPNNHALLAENNWFIFDRSGSNVLLRGKALGPITLRNNRVVGDADWGIKPNDESDNRHFSDRKSAELLKYDGSLKSLPLKP